MSWYDIRGLLDVVVISVVVVSVVVISVVVISVINDSLILTLKQLDNCIMGVRECKIGGISSVLLSPVLLLSLLVAKLATMCAAKSVFGVVSGVSS